MCGYESKRYRDDDTARAVEEGRMLIPWNGDDSLRVDRYDVRNLTDDSQKLARFRGVYRRSPQQVELHRKLETERYRDLVEATATGAAAAAAAAEVVEEEAREELRRVDEKRRGDAMFFQLDYSTLLPAPPPPPQPPTIYIPRFAVPDNIQLVYTHTKKKNFFFFLNFYYFAATNGEAERNHREDGKVFRLQQGPSNCAARSCQAGAQSSLSVPRACG